MDILDIVKDYLKENQYDGLYNSDGECACELSDFRPCGESFCECKPGIKKTYDELLENQKEHSDGACDFYIVARD